MAGQTVAGIDRDGDGHFAGGDHVDGDAVLVEDIEDGLEVAVRHEHAACDDVDDGELFFDGDALEGGPAGRRDRSDARAFACGVARVEDQNRDVLLHGRQDGCRMQDLCAEVGEFRGLFKRDGFDTQSIAADARIGGHDAVDVGPDFDGTGMQCTAGERSGEVAAAAAERGGDAGGGCADEAAHDGHFAGFQQGQRVRGECGLDGRFERGGLAERVVGDDAGAGVEVGTAATPRRAESAAATMREESRSPKLTTRSVVRGCEFADGGDAAEQVVQGIELGVEHLCVDGGALGRAEQAWRRFLRVAGAEPCR